MFTASSLSTLNQGQFEEAIKLVGKEFMNRLEYYRDSWLPARSLVERALLDRYQVHLQIFCNE